jgi:hypothetical protein
VATSAAESNLAAGNYAFRAKYVAGTDANHNDSAWSDCEPFTIAKATPGLSTTVKDSGGMTVDNTHPAAPPATVHDTATLSGAVTGFSLNGTATVTYKLFNNGTCAAGTSNANVLATDVKTVDSGGNVPDSDPHGPLSPGSYSFQATYSGNDNYASKTGECEPFKVVQKSLITDTSLCTFDLDTSSSAPGNTFRLIYTPDSSPSIYKLNASNPGQFYYNVFDNAPTNTIKFTLPYPFVTQGATPIHVYNSVTLQSVNGQTCLVPGTEIANSGSGITLDSYTDTNNDGKVGFGDTASVSVSFTSGTGFAYANIHVDYGLKSTTGWSKGGTNGNDALSTLVPPLPSILDYQSYSFSETDGTSDTQVASSRNVFKKDPGIAGLVLKNGTMMPVPNVTVNIYDASNKLQGTVTTDPDGWFMWNYKYTGKAQTFTVKLPAYNLSQSVTLKSNGFVVASPFLVP